jgi:hypothetical protein
MKKRQFCITTYYDDRYEPVGNISLLTQRKYAQMHGADFFVSNNADIECDRPIAWRKIQVIKNLFSLGYQYVLWVDADALFVRYDVSFFLNEIEYGKDVYLTAHPEGIRKIPNSGVFMVKNSFFGRRFLKRIWDLSIYTDHVWWENAAIIHLISKEDFSDHSIPNNRKTLNDHEMKKIKYLDIKWNSIPEAYEGKACVDDPIIKHYAGFPFDYRYQCMNADFIKSAR